MSHAPHDWATELTARIRKVASGLNAHAAVLFDLQGPSIRTGDLSEPFVLKPGDKIEFRQSTAEPKLEFSTTVNYDDLMKDVVAGKTLVVDNGAILMHIDEALPDRIVCTVKTEGGLGNRRHINLPGIRLNLPALTEKDFKDLQLAVDNEADFIAGSFVRDAAHVEELRSSMEEIGGNAHIVAKVEDQEAVRNIDDIISAADVIMVARGDLGIEINIEELPIIQRRIVRRCQKYGKRVIVATQLLESMLENPLPTRAEVTDVANAVFEEADAIMLSGETSIGKYPKECVDILDRISRRIERSGGLNFAKEAVLRTEKAHTANAAVTLANSLPGASVVVFTRRGRMANQVGMLRPRNEIFAFTPTNETCRRLSLSRGVQAFQMDFYGNPERTINEAVKSLREKGLVRKGAPLVIVSDVLQQDMTVDSILLHHA